MKYQPHEEATARFNGNIAEVDWAKATGYNEPTIRRYSYSYDPLNRLTNAYFSEPNVTLPSTEFYNEDIFYDLNGNITSLKRNAPSFYNNYPELIDDLSYTYTGNRLIAITDYSGNPTGYEGGGNVISYDDNGNMTALLDKSIEEIQYNHLNLPVNFDIDGSSIGMNYLYRADGTKLKKNYVSTGPGGQMFSTSTEYIDGFHYTSSVGDEELWALFSEAGGQAYEMEAFISFVNEQNLTDELMFFPTAEGFYDFKNNEYIYQYKPTKEVRRFH